MRVWKDRELVKYILFFQKGPEIIKCEGTPIDWKKGKNVTVKVIKKVQKHASRGTRRTVTKTVQNDSFFNFFSPPAVADGEDPDEVKYLCKIAQIRCMIAQIRRMIAEVIRKDALWIAEIRHNHDSTDNDRTG